MPDEGFGGGDALLQRELGEHRVELREGMGTEEAVVLPVPSELQE